MKTLRLFFLILTTFILTCCSENKYYSVEFDNVNGLEEKADVYFKGQSIGKVVKIELNENRKVIVTLEIDKNFNMPNYYQFSMFSETILGTKAIELSEKAKNESNELLENSKGIIQKDNLIDSLSNQAITIFESLTKQQNDKYDSLLIELRRLNENLENLKNEK